MRGSVYRGEREGKKTKQFVGEQTLEHQDFNHIGTHICTLQTKSLKQIIHLYSTWYGLYFDLPLPYIPILHTYEQM